MRGFLLWESQDHFALLSTYYFYLKRWLQHGLLGYHWPRELVQENTCFHPGLIYSLSRHCDVPQRRNWFGLWVWGCTSTVRFLTPWICSSLFLCSPMDNLCPVNPHLQVACEQLCRPWSQGFTQAIQSHLLPVFHRPFQLCLLVTVFSEGNLEPCWARK